jgi:hypothetical protein
MTVPPTGTARIQRAVTPWEHHAPDDSTLPETLTLDEAYRAAFFLADLYVDKLSTCVL